MLYGGGSEYYFLSMFFLLSLAAFAVVGSGLSAQKRLKPVARMRKHTSRISTVPGTMATSATAFTDLPNTHQQDRNSAQTDALVWLKSILIQMYQYWWHQLYRNRWQHWFGW